VRALDNPWTMLDHLEAIFATVVGLTDETCPDAVNVSWLRLAVPSDQETNHARWETGPTWRVIQTAHCTPAPGAARRLIRGRSSPAVPSSSTASCMDCSCDV
jgi:hypothetical protein